MPSMPCSAPRRWRAMPHWPAATRWNATCATCCAAASIRRRTTPCFSPPAAPAGGRAAIHVISGGDDTDQHRDGDWLGKDDRYARTDEYVGILKRVWTEQAPVSHSGDYYNIEGASTELRTVQRPRIPI